MGNCQAIDNASLVIQHPGGRAERLYWPITANEVMKLNPGHYVALLLTTTLYSNSAAAGTKEDNKIAPTNTNNQPLRVTRIKLLRPSDILSLGHAYRLITTQEVLKGLYEKKHGKTRKKIQSESGGKPPEHDMRGIRGSSDFEKASTRSDQLDKTHQVKIRHQKQQQRPRTSSASSSRGWHPSLNSISEASS